ncbi:MAG: GNAT family N-acetyltransferase [Deltaproteobacteria bacterium]|nr:GNAT family N-acetyltransferase [Deltaproteobacteria bacterium]
MVARVRVVPSFADVDANDWDRLVGSTDNPFVEHAFLWGLEQSGSLGTSWQPRIVLVEQDGVIMAAAPAFLRTDSFGEFIFDWQIADAAKRFGVRYFPKLTVAVPFTPATGPRLLLAHPDSEPMLLAGLFDLERTEGASSTHLLFCTDREAASLARNGYLRRASLQFHWRNDGYGSFDDFLGALSHEERKQIRRERRRVTEAGLVVEVRAGADVPPAWWPKLHALYAGIYDRKWGRPYLTRRFFDAIPKTLGDRAVVVVARDPGKNEVDGVVAMTLSFERGKHCYGRYWGSDVDVPGLHFELCYYALIERAIARGQTLVEAGAQGEHKLKRGYLPVITHSAHRFADPRFAGAVARFFVDESVAVTHERDELALHGPFKVGSAPPTPLVAGL